MATTTVHDDLTRGNKGKLEVGGVRGDHNLTVVGATNYGVTHGLFAVTLFPLVTRFSLRLCIFLCIASISNFELVHKRLDFAAYLSSYHSVKLHQIFTSTIRPPLVRIKKKKQDLAQIKGFGGK